MAIFLVKVGVVIGRAIAKPIASALEARAMSHPRFREFLIRIANGYHRFEVELTRIVENRTGRSFTGRMTDDEAMKSASKIFSEGFLIAVAIALMSYEYTVSSREADKKRVDSERTNQQLQSRLESIESNHEELLKRFGTLDERVNQLFDMLLKWEEEERKRRERKWFGFAAAGAR